MDEAADKVRNAGAWISGKFALVFALAGAAAVATNYAIGRFTLPDRAEIEALRLEKAELEASIADLTKRGGKIKFNTCGGRLCIEASSNQGETAPKWEGAAWHNEQNGAALVIPREGVRDFVSSSAKSRVRHPVAERYGKSIQGRFPVTWVFRRNLTSDSGIVTSHSGRT